MAAMNTTNLLYRELCQLIAPRFIDTTGYIEILGALTKCAHRYIAITFDWENLDALIHQKLVQEFDGTQSSSPVQQIISSILNHLSEFHVEYLQAVIPLHALSRLFKLSPENLNNLIAHADAIVTIKVDHCKLTQCASSAFARMNEKKFLFHMIQNEAPFPLVKALFNTSKREFVELRKLSGLCNKNKGGARKLPYDALLHVRKTWIKHENLSPAERYVKTHDECGASFFEIYQSVKDLLQEKHCAV